MISNDPGADPFWLRQLRKIEDLAHKPWLMGMMTSGDGRVHPEHLVFQAPTSRSSTRRPELTSLPRQLRPLVVPAAGNGIVELDYKGMEILVAAIRFEDQKLLDAYSSGDVISFLAREIFSHELRNLSLGEIADNHDDLRGQAKTIVYGVLYGRKAHSLARSLGVSEMVAQQLIDRLLAFCPAVGAGMKRLVRAARRSGRIPIAFGLARYLTPEEWSQPWMVETRAKNTPIQGTAAVIFRYAMVLVARAIAPLGGRIILPVHDAFVLEGPLAQLAAITAAAKQAMVDAFRLISPTATPFVEVDGANPTCWCKKGKAESFEHYVEDPTMD